MRRHAKAPSAVTAAHGTTRARKTIFGTVCVCVLGFAAFLGSGAPSAGAAGAFPGQGFLPDNRAWEMVSPTDKNGGEVMVDVTRTRAAADGSAFGFASLSAFAGAVGTGVSTDYVSVRGADRWAAHAITPPQEPLPASYSSQVSLYRGEFSADLSRGVFLAFSPLTDEPNVAQVQNLYLRSDLRTPGPGQYALVTDSAALQPLPGFAEGIPYLAGASDDFGNVIFESKLNLTGDATGDFPKLYEWDHGAVRLAGVLPDSACGSPPCPAASSAAGFGATAPVNSYTQTTISNDGSRVFFTSPVENAGDPTSGSQLYMRTNHATTVRINASEKTPPEAVSADALFEVATDDGRKVFFTSSEQLTNTPGSGLYAYDTTKPDSDLDNLTLLAAGNVAGVIGVSDAGDVVYFVATNQFGSAPPSPDQKIYRWEAGQIRYIGTFQNSDDSGNSLTRVTYSLARKTSRVSAAGRYLTFLSHTGSGLTGFAHSPGCIPTAVGQTCSEVYVYDAVANGGAGELFCASCNPDGASATSDATWVARVGQGVSPATAHLNQALSDDGRRVFFTSGEPLVPEDQNGDVRDVYMFDTQAREVHLISSGESNQNSYFLDAGPSGNDVFFATRERLSGWDVDPAYDVYDARVNGGLPEPPAPPPSCQGDACQPAPVALNDQTPSSSAFAGPGDPQARKARARKRCAKGKRRVTRNGKARCVKKKSAKRKNRANTDRRASR